MKTSANLGLLLALLFVTLGSYDFQYLFRADLPQAGLNIYHNIVMGSDMEANSSYTTATGNFKTDFDMGLLAWLDQLFVLKGNLYLITIIFCYST